MWDLSHWMASILFSVAIFHAVGKPNLTILVSNFVVLQMTENVLCAMFAFWQGFMHVSKDVFYKDNNIVLSSIYQVLNVNPRGMFWTITNHRHQIVNKNVHNNSQGNVITLGTFTSVGNIIVERRFDEGRTHFSFSQLKVFYPNCEVVVYQSLWFFWWKWPFPS